MQVSAHDCEDIDRALRYHAAEQLLPPGAESSARAHKRRALQVSAGLKRVHIRTSLHDPGLLDCTTSTCQRLCRQTGLLH